jgi:hypothetical protein
VAMRRALVEQTLIVANRMAQACIALLVLCLCSGASGEVSAGVRPIPWPSFIMSVGCYISWEVSGAWKPPWSFQSWQSIKVMSTLREILKSVIDVPQLSGFDALETLQLNNQWSHDKLSGSIDVLVTVKSLKVLWLQSNAFMGQISYFSGLQLVEFNMRDNLLTGPVPTSLTEMGDHKEVFHSLQELFPLRLIIVY